MKRFLLLAGCLLSWTLLSAQEKTSIPQDVFYLLPEFAPGAVYYQGKLPIQAQLNICAVDNSVRFKDKDGKELAADDTDLVQVTIGDATFVRDENRFLRLYPVAGDVSIAVYRNVLILNDTKTSGYGGQSQTTAVTQFDSFRSDGKLYTLDEIKELPFQMTETASLCRGRSIMALNKRNLLKCFPNSKEAIETYFKTHKNLPVTDIPAVMELCRGWAQ